MVENLKNKLDELTEINLEQATSMKEAEDDYNDCIQSLKEEQHEKIEKLKN